MSKTPEDHAAYLAAFDVARDALESGDHPRAVAIMRQHVEPDAADRIVARMPGANPQWAAGASAPRSTGGWDDREVVEVVPPTPDEVRELAEHERYPLRGATVERRIELARSDRARAREIERADAAIEWLVKIGHGYGTEYRAILRNVIETERELDRIYEEDPGQLEQPDARTRVLAEKQSRRVERLNQIRTRAPAILARRGILA